MAINCNRQESRLAATEKLLTKATAGTPEYDQLLARKESQTIALAEAEKAYPKALRKHIRHCNHSKMKDEKGRNMSHVRILEKGEKIQKPLGTGNG